MANPDVNGVFPEEESERRKMRKEALTRMRLLGIDPEDIEAFARGELTKVFVDREEMTVRRQMLSEDEKALIAKAETESEIPFLAYYVINDAVTFPDGTVCNRYILPYVWDEKWDWTGGENEREEGDLWEETRRNMIETKWISCYVINADIPEYSEFGELPYQLVGDMLIVD